MFGHTSAFTAAAAVASVGLLLGIGPAEADPQGCPVGATVDGDGCSARMTSVTADDVDGTLTFTPVGGSTPITVFGEPDFYLPSTGFGSAVPDLVAQWDATVHRVRDVDPADPGWYGQGKAQAFLPRQLNQLATQLPAGTIAIRFVPDESDPHILQLQSIRPVG